jgi:hypothetical protein
MADFLRLAASRANHGKRIALIYNVGRCGSTLLSHAISEATPSTSLSETPFHLQAIRIRQRMGDAWTVNTMRAITDWYAAQFGPCSDEGQLVIKIPHTSTAIHELIDASAPQSRAIFMYRDARQVIASKDRVTGSIHGRIRWAFQIPVIRGIAASIASLLSLPFGEWFRSADQALLGGHSARLVRKHGYLAVLTLMWIVDVHLFLAMRRRRDVPAVRYEDLTPETFPAILEELGLGPVDRVALRSVMGRDSQAGTALSRRRKGIGLTAHDMETVQSLIELHTAIGRADAVLPGTVRPSAELAPGLA